MHRPLLILDIDETLVHSSEAPLERPADFSVGPYAVYRRPHVETFLQRADAHYTLAVWSTSSQAYARHVVDELFGAVRPPAFIWSRSACELQLHSQLGVEIWIKDLSRVVVEGYTLERTLIVDDSPEKVCRQPANLLPVTLYTGALDDDELLRLADYLPALAALPDLQTVDKRRWRTVRADVTLRGDARRSRS